MSVSRADFFHSTARLNEQTFEQLFNEHYTRIFAVLFRLTGDRYEADDLTSETFWRLWEKPPAQFENAAGWLYRVATNLGYNALRAGKRRELYELASNADQDAIGKPAQQDPVQETERHQERERVRAVLRQMPARDVQVLVLRHSGLSYKEIAAAAGVATSSIGTLLARAEARFETLYRLGEEPCT